MHTPPETSVHSGVERLSYSLWPPKYDRHDVDVVPVSSITGRRCTRTAQTLGFFRAQVGTEVALYLPVMLTMRWFAYALLLAAAFAIGLIGTMKASRALAPKPAETTPVLTTPTATTPNVTARPIEC